MASEARRETAGDGTQRLGKTGQPVVGDNAELLGITFRGLLSSPWRQAEPLGGHFKPGQTWTAQSRP